MNQSQRKVKPPSYFMDSAAFSTLYEKIPALLQVMDRHGRLVYVNNCWLEKLGYDRREVTGRKATEFLTEASRRYAEEVVLPEYFQTGSCRDISYQFVKKNGEILQILFSATAERDKLGNIADSCCILMDITEQHCRQTELQQECDRLKQLLETSKAELMPLKASGQFSQISGDIQRDISDRNKAEKVLQEREQQLSLALKAAHAGIWQWDRKTNQTIWSDENFRLLGYEPGSCKASYENLVRVLHPEDREQVNLILRQMKQEQTDLTLEFRVLLPDGSKRWLAAIGQFIRKGMRGILIDITDRKQAEAALKESESQLLSVLENAPSLISKIDREGNIQFINRMLPEFSYNEVIGNNFNNGNYALPGIQLVQRNALKEVFESKQPIRFETVAVGINQTMAYYDVRIAPICDKEKVEAAIVITTDISDRKQAEIALQQLNQELEARVQQRTEALQQSEEKFRQMAENIDQVFWLLDWETHKILYVSPAYERIWGSSVASLSADSIPWKTAIHPDDRDRVLQAIAKQPSDEYDEEYRIIRPDNEVRWIRDRAFPIRDQTGRIYRIAGIAEDISDRKYAEVAIHLLNATLERQKCNLEFLVEQRTAEVLALVNALPDYIFVVEAQNMKIRFCNDVFARGMGFESRFALQGKTIFDCFNPDLADYFKQQNQEIFTSGKSLHLQESLVLGDSLHHFDSHKIPLKNKQGEVYALLGAAHDITELVEIKRTLAARSVELEAMNQELDSFSYSVSHDLRAPLRHIHGFVNALRQRLELAGALNDPKVAHYLQVIQDSSQRMGQLIDGLLALAQLGRQELNFQPVDLRQLVENAIALVHSPPHPRENRQIQFNIGSLPKVRGDETLLQQVFNNLISNAVKFSRDRSLAEIEISSLPDETIFVKDNGVGFDMESAAQLFGAFQRLHSSREFEGNGIGLSIVQRIIHRHGGTIWAESQPGQGATFCFKLDKN